MFIIYFVNNYVNIITVGGPGIPPPPGMPRIPTGPQLKEKKKYKVDIQMRRMNWNQVNCINFDRHF